MDKIQTLNIKLPWKDGRWDYKHSANERENERVLRCLNYFPKGTDILRDLDKFKQFDGPVPADLSEGKVFLITKVKDE